MKRKRLRRKRLGRERLGRKRLRRKRLRRKRLRRKRLCCCLMRGRLRPGKRRRPRRLRSSGGRRRRRRRRRRWRRRRGVRRSRRRRRTRIVVVGTARRRGGGRFAEKVFESVAFDGHLKVLEGSAAGVVDEELRRQRHSLLPGQKPKNENERTRQNDVAAAQHSQTFILDSVLHHEFPLVGHEGHVYHLMLDTHVSQEKEDSLLPLLRLHLHHRRRDVNLQHHLQAAFGSPD